jgi:hypothetical protein
LPAPFVRQNRAFGDGIAYPQSNGPNAQFNSFSWIERLANLKYLALDLSSLFPFTFSIKALAEDGRKVIEDQVNARGKVPRCLANVCKSGIG